MERVEIHCNAWHLTRNDEYVHVPLRSKFLQGQIYVETNFHRKNLSRELIFAILVDLAKFGKISYLKISQKLQIGEFFSKKKDKT